MYSNELIYLGSPLPHSQAHCLLREENPVLVPHNLIQVVSAKPGNTEIKFKRALIYHQRCSQNSNHRLVNLGSREAHQGTSCGPPLTHPHTRRTNDNLEKKDLSLETESTQFCLWPSGSGKNTSSLFWQGFDFTTTPVAEKRKRIDKLFIALVDKDGCPPPQQRSYISVSIFTAFDYTAHTALGYRKVPDKSKL